MKQDYYLSIAQQRGDAYALAVEADDAEKLRQSALVDDPTPTPAPEPPDPEPDEDGQYSILWE